MINSQCFPKMSRFIEAKIPKMDNFVDKKFPIWSDSFSQNRQKNPWFNVQCAVTPFLSPNPNDEEY